MRKSDHAAYLARLFDATQPAIDLDSMATFTCAPTKARNKRPMRIVTVVTVKRGRNAMRTIEVRS